MTQAQLTTIREELNVNGIPTTGLYSTLPEIVYKAIIACNMNGFENWSSSSIFSDKVKNVVKKLHEKASL